MIVYKDLIKGLRRSLNQWDEHLDMNCHERCTKSGECDEDFAEIKALEKMCDDADHYHLKGLRVQVRRHPQGSLGHTFDYVLYSGTHKMMESCTFTYSEQFTRKAAQRFADKLGVPLTKKVNKS